MPTGFKNAVIMGAGFAVGGAVVALVLGLGAQLIGGAAGGALKNAAGQ